MVKQTNHSLTIVALCHYPPICHHHCLRCQCVLSSSHNTWRWRPNTCPVVNFVPYVDIQWLSDDYLLFLMIFIRIISWPCINNMLINSDYLMITCCFCWYSVRIISWPCVDIQWLSDDYLLFLLIFSQDHQLTRGSYYVDIQWLSDDYLLFLLIFSQNHQFTLY